MVCGVPGNIALVQLPFAPVRWPSIGLGYLASTLKAAGHTVHVIDLNLRAYRGLTAVIPGLSLNAWEVLSPEHPGHLVCSHLIWPKQIPERRALEAACRAVYTYDLLEAQKVLSQLFSDWIDKPEMAAVNIVGLSILNTQLLSSIVVRHDLLLGGALLGLFARSGLNLEQ